MSDDRLVRVLAYLADLAAANHTVVSSGTACEACVALLDVDGAGLSLMNGSGQGETQYATNKISALIEDTQFTMGEGPGVDAFRSAMPVLVSDLDSGSGRRRWPMFTAVAVTAGVRAVFAFPLRSGAIRLGTLAAHRSTPGPLTSGQVADALVVADLILSQLLGELRPTHHPPGGRPTDGFPLSRTEVHQAAGMISAQLGVPMEEAMMRLRAYAFAHERTIADVARDVVTRRLRLNPEPDPT
ncbi:GAF and ANTAR domain-containing protein [Actinocrispum wychmicini]|uniref:ANTAR domain-containing protein n=1 Tax=Actinocrispum wychmicini TaxID=1213861 RepID=A0A4R2ITW6_9PSEU|nr:GAF and ANTAR domain-containing protein [Actinocrispum wychmicini]TCO48983.1 ANTAR domain-containing protein [Actinocrispum wychmicini]